MSTTAVKGDKLVEEAAAKKKEMIKKI